MVSVKMNEPKHVLTEDEKRRIAEHRAMALKIRSEIAAKQAQDHDRKSNVSKIETVVPNKPKENLTVQQFQKNNIYQNQAILKCSLSGSCTLISNERFMVDIGYNSKLIDLFKKIPSRAYDAVSKKWNFKIQDHDQLIKDVKSLKNEVNVIPLPSYVTGILSKSTSSNKREEIDLKSLEPGLEEALYPFQKEGIQFVINKGGRAIIADDMGLGKTIQAIGVASYYRKDWPLLIISPSSVRYSWFEAITKWLPSLKPSEITVADNAKNQFGKVTVLIISYDLLARKSEYMKMRSFGVVIVDESHFIKNYKASRTQAIVPILQQATRVILLSGTPALSRPSELYTQLTVVKPKLFPSFHEFGLRYCGGKKMAWAWDYSGATNMTELQIIMEEAVLIRRLKSEVITDLPAKLREMVVLDPNKINHHKNIETAAEKWSLKELKGMEKRGALLQYFHETGLAKMRAVSEYVVDQVDCGKKFLCFAHHDVVISNICECLENKKVHYIRIDGKTAAQERKLLCDTFQYNESCRVAVLSITAANMGLTLTSAQFVIFGELFWNPGILTQAEDRVHRIGQTNSVVIQYLVAKRTADDYLWPIVQNKLEVLNKAGLSKDNFQDVNLRTMEQNQQLTLDDFEIFDAEPEVKRLRF